MKLKDYDKQDITRFSRRWWFLAGRSLFWAAIVTLLIWVYADMEFIDTETVTATVRLTAGDGRDEVLLAYRQGEQRYEEIPYRDVKLTFRARGSRSSLNKFKSRFSGSGPHFIHDVSKMLAPGKHNIPAADVLQYAPDRERLNIGVGSPSPREIRDVHLDEVIEREVFVELDWEDSQLKPKIDKREVKIRISNLRWQQIEESQPVLKTEKQNLHGRMPGEEFIIENVAIIPEIAGETVRLTEPTIDIKVKLEPQAMKKATINIPVVWILTPRTWPSDGTWEKFTLILSDRTPWKNVPIEVAGPPDEVNELIRDPSKAQAYIVLTKVDMTHTPTEWGKT
ncbi:MAG: YbbR-like domain-containing protein [Planctomycetota bacterium]|jgi:hypothetical protein